jgi:hypothetical protein
MKGMKGMDGKAIHGNAIAIPLPLCNLYPLAHFPACDPSPTTRHFIPSPISSQAETIAFPKSPVDSSAFPVVSYHCF